MSLATQDSSVRGARSHPPSQCRTPEPERNEYSDAEAQHQGPGTSSSQQQSPHGNGHSYGVSGSIAHSLLRPSGGSGATGGMSLSGQQHNNTGTSNGIGVSKLQGKRNADSNGKGSNDASCMSSLGSARSAGGGSTGLSAGAGWQARLAPRAVSHLLSTGNGAAEGIRGGLLGGSEHGGAVHSGSIALSAQLGGSKC